jgi:hypothetical protein
VIGDQPGRAQDRPVATEHDGQIDRLAEGIFWNDLGAAWRHLIFRRNHGHVALGDQPRDERFEQRTDLGLVGFRDKANSHGPFSYHEAMTLRSRSVDDDKARGFQPA